MIYQFHSDLVLPLFVCADEHLAMKAVGESWMDHLPADNWNTEGIKEAMMLTNIFYCDINTNFFHIWTPHIWILSLKEFPGFTTTCNKNYKQSSHFLTFHFDWGVLELHWLVWWSTVLTLHWYVTAVLGLMYLQVEVAGLDQSVEAMGRPHFVQKADLQKPKLQMSLQLCQMLKHLPCYHHQPPSL